MVLGSGDEGSDQGSAPAAARAANLAGGVADIEQAAVRVWRSCNDHPSKVIIEISSPARLLALSRFVQLLEQQGLHSFDLTVSPNHHTNMHCLRAEVEAQLSAAQLHTLQSILADQILRSESDITT